MIPFELHLPTRIIFGSDTFPRFAAETARVGKRALLVTGRTSARRLGLTDRATRLLADEGVHSILFERVEPNPRVDTIDEGAALAVLEGCDVVVALGGGSVMDAAKGIAAVAACGGSVWEYVRKGSEKPRSARSALPIIAIPTLAATGSEVNGYTIITNDETKEKGMMAGRTLFPVAAVVDPALTVTTPPHLTADGGVDILCHLLETWFTGSEDSPIQDGMTEAIARVVIHETPKAVRDGADMTARGNLSWASTLALSGIPDSGRGGGFPLHAIEHSVSAHYDISHGRGLACLLPAIMEYTCDVRPERYVQLGERVFGLDLSGMAQKEGALRSVETVRKWLMGLGIEPALSALGIDDSRFETMADDAIRLYGKGMDYLDNPRPLYKDDIIAIYHKAR